MRHCLKALVVSSAIVSGCSLTDDKPAPQIRTIYLTPELPAVAKVPCREPVKVPDRDLSEKEILSGWGKDRTSLRECESKRGSAVQAVDAAASESGG